MLHLLTDLKHSVNSVCFSADGDLLVSGSDDKTLKVWSKGSSGTFECQSTLTGHSERVNCVVFSPNGKVIASCSGEGYMRDNSVRLWDASTGEPIGSPLTVDSGEYGVLSVSFSPKDNVIAAGCYNGKIHLVDAVAGEVKSTLTGHNGYVPAFPCSACSQSRGVCSLFSDTQGCQLRRV